MNTNYSFYLEQSAFGSDGRWVVLRGWAFDTTAKLKGVRLHVPGGHTTNGAYGCIRPDVVQTYPEAKDAAVGFIIKARLGSKQDAGEVQVLTAKDEWHSLFTVPLPVQSAVPLWLSRNGASLLATQLVAQPYHRPKPLRQEHWPHGTKPAVTQMTVVVPTKNQSVFLPATVDSVLQDETCPLRCIVQDGGSTDTTIEYLGRLDTPRLSWSSEPDPGQTHAISKAFAKTSGAPEDVMAWINSDDFYLPGALGYVARFFETHPEVDVVYGHRVLVDENSQEIGRWFLPPHDDEVLRLNDFVPQETMFWRRRIWEKVGGIDPSFKFAMDWDLVLRFQAAGAKIVRVPYFLACFRLHAAQKTSAQMESLGQKEIDGLRLRTFGRVLTPQEIEHNPRLIRYLRTSAWIEFLWRRLRIRAN